jgi:hypothetical protein
MRTITILVCAFFSNTVVYADANAGLKEFTTGEVVRFSTDGHPKAKGANFSFRHPKSWVAKEGDRPNIIQKFVSDDGIGSAMLAITVRSFPVPAGTEPSNADLEKMFDPANQKELLPEGTRFIDAKKVHIDGRLASILETSEQQETVGIKVDMRSFEVMFFDRALLVIMRFSIASTPDRVVDLEQSMKEFKPLFTIIANGIMVESRYRK